MLKPKDLSRILSPRRCVVIIYKIRYKLKILKVKMWHFVYVNIVCKICMHGFEKNRLRQKNYGDLGDELKSHPFLVHFSDLFFFLIRLIYVQKYGITNQTVL